MFRTSSEILAPDMLAELFDPSWVVPVEREAETPSKTKRGPYRPRAPKPLPPVDVTDADFEKWLNK